MTKGWKGSRKKWKSVTPAMAAGLTDHVWTMDELLSFRVPQIVTIISCSLCHAPTNFTNSYFAPEPPIAPAVLYHGHGTN